MAAWVFPLDFGTARPILEYSTPQAVRHPFLGEPEFLRSTVSGFGLRQPCGFNGGSPHLCDERCGGSFAAHQWNHVALTYDQTTGTARIYVNGSAVTVANLGDIYAQDIRAAEHRLAA